MKKLLVVTFTHDENREYFLFWIRHINKAMKYMRTFPDGLRVSWLVIDFSKERNGTIHRDMEWMEPQTSGTKFHYFQRPGAGFCDNVNFTLDYAAEEEYDYVAEVNDDAYVPENFFIVGVNFLDQKDKAALVGGFPQHGRWCQSILDHRIPPPIDKEEKVTNFRRLWWEMSACVLDVERVGNVRFDPYFDRCLGLCGDNDFFISLARQGKEAWRNYRMRFFHCRGITQQKFGRQPFRKKDEIRDRAVEYFYLKHGVNISDLDGDTRLEDIYDTPFNGEDVSVLDNGDLLIGGVRVEV